MSRRSSWHNRQLLGVPRRRKVAGRRPAFRFASFLSRLIHMCQLLLKRRFVALCRARALGLVHRQGPGCALRRGGLFRPAGAAQELHAVRAHLERRTRLALLLPTPVDQPPFHAHQPPFREVLLAALGLLAPHHNADKAGFFFWIPTVRTADGRIDGQPETRHRRPAGGIAKRRLTRQVADQQHPIEIRHGHTLAGCLTGSAASACVLESAGTSGTPPLAWCRIRNRITASLRRNSRFNYST